MAEAPLNQEEQALRRRARRRLVGAVALALLAVVVLPMIFDPEPRPLGGNVEIHIPGQNTAFNAPPEPTPQAQGSTQPLPAAPVETLAANSEALPALPPTLESAPPPPIAPAPVKKPEIVKPAPKPTPKVPEKPVEKPVPGKPAEPKVTTKPAPAKAEPAKQTASNDAPAKPTVDFSSRGYFLQLGAFSNESNARQLADRAKSAGINASVVSSAGQSKVRVGPYGERDKALEMQAKLKDKGLKSVLIGP